MALPIILFLLAAGLAALNFLTMNVGG